jgi:signal transduction histidine kinase
MDEQGQAGLPQTQFLSLLAHDLRAPLHTIQGYLNLALTGVGGELNAQQHEFIQRASVASQYLYALLEDVLCIARADSGQLHLQRKITRLPDIIDNAVEELEMTAIDQGVTLCVDVEPQLPLVYVDAVRVQQVLRNLVDNAICFTPQGGRVKVTVCIERASWVEPAGSSDDTDGEDVAAVVCLRVCDTGIGIAPEFHERIFERFYRIHDKNADRSGGQGLGLSIVKLIVELHGGSVTVESAVGEGSTFSCFIPCLLS